MYILYFVFCTCTILQLFYYVHSIYVMYVYFFFTFLYNYRIMIGQHFCFFIYISQQAWFLTNSPSMTNFCWKCSVQNNCLSSSTLNKSGALDSVNLRSQDIHLAHSGCQLIVSLLFVICTPPSTMCCRTRITKKEKTIRRRLKQYSSFLYFFIVIVVFII